MSDDATFVGTLSDWLRWTSEKGKIGIERVKAQTGLPWWTTITAVTIGMRLVILPLRLRAWRNGKLMKMTVEYCNKELAPKLRKFHQEMSPPEQRNELFKAAMLQSHSATMKAMGLSPWKSLSPLPVSIPLYLSVAGGLRMIDFGGEGLGVIWNNFGESSLGSAVPVFISNLILIEYSRKRIKPTTTTKWTGKLPFILGHTLNLFSFVILTQVPSAINLFLLTSSLASLAETKYLDNPSRQTGLNRWFEGFQVPGR